MTALGSIGQQAGRGALLWGVPSLAVATVANGDGDLADTARELNTIRSLPVVQIAQAATALLVFRPSARALAATSPLPRLASLAWAGGAIAAIAGTQSLARGIGGITHHTAYREDRAAVRSAADEASAGFRALGLEPTSPKLIVDRSVSTAHFFPLRDAVTIGRHPDPGGPAFARSRDVVAHELAHALLTRYIEKMPPALGESLADVLASLAIDDGNRWQLGEATTPGGVRDGSKPVTRAEAASEDPHRVGQPATHAAFLVDQAAGRDVLAGVWSHAIRHGLREVHGIAGFARATEASARQLYGEGAQLEAVRTAWAAVGYAATDPPDPAPEG